MKKLLTRVISIALCIGVLASVLVLSTSAAALKNIVFVPRDAQSELYRQPESNEAYNSAGICFTDNSSQIIYRIPIVKTANTPVSLVLDVGANYRLEISSDKSTWVDLRHDPKMSTSTGDASPANRIEVVYDVTSYKANGFVYVRMKDLSEANGWGGQLFNVYLLYRRYVPKVIKPWEKRGVDYSFMPGSDEEKAVIEIDGGSLGETQAMRYMDAASQITYRLPVDMNKKHWLNFLVASDYVVTLGMVPSGRFKAIARATEEDGRVGEGNAAFYSFDVQKTVKKLYPGETPTYIYIRIGDQTTTDGNGGQIRYMGIKYGNNPGTYNALTNGGKSTGIRFTSPQRVSKIRHYKKTVTEYSTVTVESTIPGTPEEIIPSEELSVEVSSQQPEEQPVEERSIGDHLWYIILGILGILLVAAAATQFILMERKRKMGGDK